MFRSNSTPRSAEGVLAPDGAGFCSSLDFEGGRRDFRRWMLWRNLRPVAHDSSFWRKPQASASTCNQGVVAHVTPPSVVVQRVPLSETTMPCCGSAKRMETMAPVSTLEFAATDTLLQCSPLSDEWKSAPPLPPAQTLFPRTATARKVTGWSSSTRVHWSEPVDRSRWPVRANAPLRTHHLRRIHSCH